MKGIGSIISPTETPRKHLKMAIPLKEDLSTVNVQGPEYISGRVDYTANFRAYSSKICLDRRVSWPCETVQSSKASSTATKNSISLHA
jgi:hypothetical protein